MRIISLFFILLLSSCSLLRGSSTRSGGKLPSYKKKYILTDKSGSFDVTRESGHTDKGKGYFTKYRVKNTEGDQSKVLEQSVVISTPGVVGKKLPILRPKLYQYDVWFEKKKYSAIGKLLPQQRSMSVQLISPEGQWNKVEQHSFPKGVRVFCFLSQVVECAQMTGFLAKAVKLDTGKMNFYLLLEGFPYFQEQYLNIPPGLFTRAILAYDGKNQTGESRFSLQFGGTTIFYFVNKSYELVKMFWPSQGFSMTENDS